MLHNLSLDPKVKALAPDSENKVYFCGLSLFVHMCSLFFGLTLISFGHVIEIVSLLIPVSLSFV